MIRTAAFAGVLVLWGLVAYGNRALALMNPVLLPTPEIGRASCRERV